MKLTANYRSFIRFGLIAVGLAGILFAAGDALIPQEGAMFAAVERPDDFADLVTGGSFVFWALRGVIGVPLETIGTIALFLGLAGTARELWAFWGMLLCVVADLFGAAYFLIAYTIFPVIGELMQQGTWAVSAAASPDLLMPFLGGGYIATGIGLALLAGAIWKSDRFPSWSGILVLVGWLLLIVQVYAVQVGANLLWGAAFLWMAAYSWNRLPGGKEEAV